MTPLTDKQMRVAIAESVGWEKVSNGVQYPDGSIFYGCMSITLKCPDYLNDLNAIIPLLPVGTYIERYDGLWKIYIGGMMQVICRGKELGRTACEFYLRTKQLWKE